MSDLRKQAKRNMKFVNYVPQDASLGEKAPTEILQPERLEKEQSLRIEKMVRAFYADTRAPLKIIPKKSTLDIETKLKPVMEKLQLRTEIGIVSILKDQLATQKKERQNFAEDADARSSDHHANGRPQRGTTKNEGISNEVEEEAEISKQKRLQAIEENPVIKEVLSYLPRAKCSRKCSGLMSWKAKFPQTLKVIWFLAYNLWRE